MLDTGLEDKVVLITGATHGMTRRQRAHSRCTARLF